VNVFERLKYELIKAVIIRKLKAKGIPVASPLVQQVIAFVTSVLSTGDGVLGPVSVSESVDIAGQHYTITESATVEMKKS